MFSVSGHPWEVPAHSSCSQHEHRWQEEDCLRHHCHQGEYVCHDVYRWTYSFKIISVTISTLQSHCKVTYSLVCLISGCWQTLCSCRPEESRHWPQQKSWRADWGGGEKSVILTEEKLYTCQNITALVGFEGPSLNWLDHYIHNLSTQCGFKRSHRWLYFDNWPDACSFWIPVEWVVLM